MAMAISDVRRKDYEFADDAEIRQFMAGQTHGHLAFVRHDGSPGLVALNFVRVDDRIYFHGALEGEKAASIRREPRVTFMVDDDFSLIPSTFTNPVLACPATQYYKAVVVHGTARFVDSAEEKAMALQALMEKLQPQGGYRPIASDDAVYRKSLETVGVIRLDIERQTAKFKFGQNLPARKRAGVAAQLEERGAGRDVETVAAMREMCPFEQDAATRVIPPWPLVRRSPSSRPA